MGRPTCAMRSGSRRPRRCAAPGSWSAWPAPSSRPMTWSRCTPRRSTRSPARTAARSGGSRPARWRCSGGEPGDDGSRPQRAAERVHLITATVAMDGSLLDAAVAAGADGIVVAATGAGNTDPALLAAAERAIAAGLPVALATRCPSGRAGTAYAFPGGGATWIRAGALPVGHLCAVKARVALALGLGRRPRPRRAGGAPRRPTTLTPCLSTP